MEAYFPEIFTMCERLGADCKLFFTTGGSGSAGPAFAAHRVDGDPRSEGRDRF